MFVRAGFPEPKVNRDVHGRDGQWLLEGDLVWEAQRVVGEYQGRDHASIRQRSYDADRRAVAGDEDWTVLEIYAADVYQPGRRIASRRTVIPTDAFEQREGRRRTDALAAIRGRVTHHGTVG